jgi:hypothetical protein
MTAIVNRKIVRIINGPLLISLRNICVSDDLEREHNTALFVINMKYRVNVVFYVKQLRSTWSGFDVSCMSKGRM